MASIHDMTMQAYGSSIANGGSTTDYCPECGKWGFSMTNRHGKLLYHCFKAGCGFSGRVLLTGHSSLASQAQAVPQQEERLTPYRGYFRPIERSDWQALQKRFGISIEPPLVSLYRNRADNYLLPVKSAAGTLRGHVERVPWRGAELSGESTTGPPMPMKSLSWKSKEGPWLAWYKPAILINPRDMPVILVEDQMSAIKLADCGYTACALLGTNLSSEKVAEIQSVSKHIVIALDSDATATAFKLARKWQHGFSSCRVVILEKDVKDSSKEEIHAKFN